MPDPIIIEFEQVGLDDAQRDLDEWSNKIKKQSGTNVSLFGDGTSKDLADNLSNIPIELEKSTKPADDLLGKFSSMKERTASLKDDLLEVSGGEKAGAGLSGLATGLIKTGAAAIILQQGIKVVGDQYKGFLKDAEESPDLFTVEQLRRTEAMADGLSEAEGAFKKLRVRALDPFSVSIEHVSEKFSEAIDKVLLYEEGLDGLDSGFKKVTLSALNFVGIRLHNDADIKKSIDGYTEMLDLQERIVDTADKHNQMNAIGIQQRLDFIDDAKKEETKGLSFLGVTEDVQRQTENFNDSQDSLIEKQDEVIGKILEAEEKGYGPWGVTISKLKEEFDELAVALGDNVRENEKNTQQMILDNAKQLLSVDGLTAGEQKYLVQQGVALGVISETSSAKSLQIINDAENIANAYISETDKIIGQVGTIEGALDTMDNKQVDIYINAHLRWSGNTTEFGPPGAGPSVRTPGYDEFIEPRRDFQVEQANKTPAQLRAERDSLDHQLPYITQEVERILTGGL